MKRIGNERLLCILTVILVGSMITSSLPMIGASSSRTGDHKNEPAGGYYEGTDIFKIHHGNGVHNTSFNLGETVTVNITTNRVVDLNGRNRLRVSDWQRNRLIDMDPAFVVTDGSGPQYSYEASFDATIGNGFTNDNYNLEVDIKDNNGKRFHTWDVITVGGGAVVPKYIKTFIDPGFTSMSWIFNPSEVVYIEVWTGGGTPNPANSKVEFGDYQDNRDNINLDNLNNNTVTTIGDYTRIAYDMSNDIDLQAVQVNQGWWHTVQVDIKDNQNDLIREWTIQIYINIRPSIIDVGATPASIDVIGSVSSTLHVHFNDKDAPSINSFTITFAVREPNDVNTLVLVDAKSNGNGGLTIADLGGGEYNATYSWDPQDTQAVGLYDISATVLDNNRGKRVSNYWSNTDVLDLFNSFQKPPMINAGDLTANPPTVAKAGPMSTTLSVHFTDQDNADASTYFVSFWIRDGSNNVIILADGKANGGTGAFGGIVDVTKTATNEYRSSIDFDPDNTISVDIYDLYFKVVDGDGATAVDDFASNLNELEITQGGNDPEIIDVVVDPDTVDKIGNDMVEISGTFTDIDNYGLGSYIITFEVKDPNGDKITIAKDVQNMGVGDFGNVLTITKTDLIYRASIDWDPADTVVTGYYDLSMKVEDPTEAKSEDRFDNNPDELLITSSNYPPVIGAGSTWADPDIVVRTGSNSTILYANFTDVDGPPVSSFKITFKVRSPTNVETVIVKDKFKGEAGIYGRLVQVENNGGIYFASIEWDPPDIMDTGSYDLYFGVSDAFGGMAEDVYSNNQDELNIIDTIAPPTLKAGKTKANPDVVNREGTDTTVITGEFEDNSFTDVNDFFVTFMVRDKESDLIVLASNKKDGEVSESGGTVTIVNDNKGINKGFKASLTWDPPATVSAGQYDLYFAVTNKAGAKATDLFDNNLDELTVTVGQPPMITGLSAAPDRITVKGTTSTTIHATFKDGDAVGAGEFIVRFRVRDPTGTKITLVNDKTLGGAGEFGNILNVVKSGTEFNASYDWDPPETMATGLYDLEVEIQDANELKGQSSFDNNLDELELLEGVSPGNPSIIPSPLSNSKNDYTFIVSYVDLENDAPNSKGMLVIIDGKEHQMLALDDKDMDYTDGKKYFVVIPLDSGTHDYHYTVTDTSGLDATTEPDSVKVYGGGNTSANGGVDSTFSLMVLLLVLMIVIILILAVMLSRRRPGHQGPYDVHYQDQPAGGDPYADEGAHVDEEGPADDGPEAKALPDQGKGTHITDKTSETELNTDSESEPTETVSKDLDTEISEKLKDI